MFLVKSILFQKSNKEKKRKKIFVFNNVHLVKLREKKRVLRIKRKDITLYGTTIIVKFIVKIGFFYLKKYI